MEAISIFLEEDVVWLGTEQPLILYQGGRLSSTITPEIYRANDWVLLDGVAFAGTNRGLIQTGFDGEITEYPNILGEVRDIAIAHHILWLVTEKFDSGGQVQDYECEQECILGTWVGNNENDELAILVFLYENEFQAGVAMGNLRESVREDEAEDPGKIAMFDFPDEAWVSYSTENVLLVGTPYSNLGVVALLDGDFVREDLFGASFFLQRMVREQINKLILAGF